MSCTTAGTIPTDPSPPHRTTLYARCTCVPSMSRVILPHFLRPNPSAAWLSRGRILLRYRKQGTTWHLPRLPAITTTAKKTAPSHRPSNNDSKQNNDVPSMSRVILPPFLRPDPSAAWLSRRGILLRYRKQGTTWHLPRLPAATTTAKKTAPSHRPSDNDSKQNNVQPPSSEEISSSSSGTNIAVTFFPSTITCHRPKQNAPPPNTIFACAAYDTVSIPSVPADTEEAKSGMMAVFTNATVVVATARASTPP